MKKKHIVLLVVVVLMLAFRLALPSIIKNHINNKLNALEGYHASIERVCLSLYRGAAQIKGLHVVEECSTDTSIAMVILPHMEFSIAWRALFRGSFVGEVAMDSLVLNLTKLDEETTEEASEYRIAFFEEIQEMNPIQLNRFQASHATISYHDPTSDPPIHVSLNGVSVLATNLGNVRDPNVALPASVEMSGNAMGEGLIHIQADLNLLKATPDFDLNIQIEELELKKFSEFFEARADLPVEAGRLFFYSEVVGKDGAVTGYVKPAIVDLTFRRDEDASLLINTYRTLVQGVTNVLEDSEKEQVASRVEFSGTLDNTEFRNLQAVLGVFRNAFIAAYRREIEHVLTFNDGTGN